MADQFDRASDIEESYRQQAIASQLNSVSRDRLAVTGKCHNCAEPLKNGGLFCDSDCRDDHQRRLLAKRF